MNKLTLSSALAAALASQLCAQAPTQAPTLEGTVGVGGGIALQRYDGTFGHQESVYGRGVLTYHPIEWLAGRFTGGYGNLTNNNDHNPSFKTDWLSNLGVGLVLQPRIGNVPLRPYVASGVSTLFGTSRVNGVDNRDLDWTVYVPVELGIAYLIADNLSVSLWGETYAWMQDEGKLDGVKSTGNYFERRDDLQRVGIGFSFQIGSKSDADGDGVTDELDQCPGTPKGVKVDSRGCPLDSDHDGVPDYKDLCQNTAQGVKVDLNGCPIPLPPPPPPLPVPVPRVADADHDGVPDSLDKCPGSPAGSKVDSVGCPLDSDHDGVTDDKDKCPNTPWGVKVDLNGCPLPVADADHDGVPDSLDKCPGTRAGVKVDTNGCPEIVIVKGAKLIIDGIVFKTGSAVIDKVSAPVLARAAVAISKAPDARIEIAGFTDNVGGYAYNQKLSERRAASVKQYLVRSGVPTRQLSTKGYGEEEPVVDNANAASRADNRRIEFRVK